MTLDAFYREVMLGWQNCVLISEIADLDRDCWSYIESEARMYFGTEPGRRWIEAWGAGLFGGVGNPRISEVAIEAVREESVRHHGSTYNLLLSRN